MCSSSRELNQQPVLLGYINPVCALFGIHSAVRFVTFYLSLIYSPLLSTYCFKLNTAE